MLLQNICYILKTFMYRMFKVVFGLCIKINLIQTLYSRNIGVNLESFFHFLYVLYASVFMSHKVCV